MTWVDRLREAAYTSPTGERITFTYEDVSETVDRRTAAFNFPDADGTYVQELGNSGRRYPLIVIFWGANHDLEAEGFVNALLQPGTGKLEHPIYGVKDVVPFGSITRRDDLVTAANQTRIEVTFWQTIGVIYPASLGDPRSAVFGALSDFDLSGPEQFFKDIELALTVYKSVFRPNFLTTLGVVRNALSEIVEGSADVKNQFDSIYTSITTSIEILLDDPISLASQVSALTRVPGNALNSITDTLIKYGGILDTVFTASETPPVDADRTELVNTFYSNNLFATTLLAGATLSVVNNKFETKTAAIGAAEALLIQFDELVAWRDSSFDALEIVDTGEGYTDLQDAVITAVSFLVEISFTLLQEKAIVLTEPRAVIELCAELYGSVDDKLDFFINTNKFTGSEIIEIPAGRTVVYYT